MERRDSLDAIDHSILRILSLYECLDQLELWYEIGEDDAIPGNVTEEEVFSRLESLRRRGFVKSIAEPHGIAKWAVKRG